MFASYLTTSSTSTEAHYRPKKSATIIMSTPVDLDESDADDGIDVRSTKVKLTGMVIPYLQTVKGQMNVGY